VNTSLDRQRIEWEGILFVTNKLFDPMHSCLVPGTSARVARCVS
jgi:hypothetical protein